MCGDMRQCEVACTFSCMNEMQKGSLHVGLQDCSILYCIVDGYLRLLGIAGHFLIRMVFRHGRTVHSRSVNVTVTVNVTCIHLGGPGIIGRADSIGIGF